MNLMLRFCISSHFNLTGKLCHLSSAPLQAIFTLRTRPAAAVLLSTEVILLSPPLAAFGGHQKKQAATIETFNGLSSVFAERIIVSPSAIFGGNSF